MGAFAAATKGQGALSRARAATANTGKDVATKGGGGGGGGGGGTCPRCKQAPCACSSGGGAKATSGQAAVQHWFGGRTGGRTGG